MKIWACVFAIVVSCLGDNNKPASTKPVHHLQGIVLDENGQPIAGASIDHYAVPLDRSQTDAAGKFSIDIQSPAIVIRKQGYKSAWLQAKDGDAIEVQLQSLGSQHFFECPALNISESQKSLPRLKIPESRDLKIARGSDVDYNLQSFRLRGDHKKQYLTHGWGPTWSFGFPVDTEVWNSIAYEERVFDMSPISILDARGTLSSGKRWRMIGIVGETLEYDGVDEKAAAAFDSIMDRTCFQRDKAL